MKFNTVYEKNLLDYQIRKYIDWDMTRYPHGLIIGATGTGKTYLSKLILGRIGLVCKDVSITVCDFKGDDDFSFLKGSEKFYRYLDCIDGIKHFYSEFTERQSNEHDNKSMKILFIDEYASLLNSLSKKEADEIKSMIASLLMLGRSFNVHVIISQQRADSEYFAKSRDNFTFIVALGNISKEAQMMLFQDYRDFMQPVNDFGKGHMLMGGSKFYEIQVPIIKNMQKLEDYIKKSVQ